MRFGKFRRLPVVDADGKLAGLVSVDDIIMHVAEELTLIRDLIKEETPLGVAASDL